MTMKCPNCGGSVLATNTINIEYENNSYYYTVEGICPDCGKSWYWDEVFTFDHCENIEEIKLNDHL